MLFYYPRAIVFVLACPPLFLPLLTTLNSCGPARSKPLYDKEYITHGKEIQDFLLLFIGHNLYSKKMVLRVSEAFYDSYWDS